MTTSNELTTSCPECLGTITLPADTFEHEIYQCADCGVELEIISLEPLTVEVAPQVEEDWGE